MCSSSFFTLYFMYEWCESIRTHRNQMPKLYNPAVWIWRHNTAHRFESTDTHKFLDWALLYKVCENIGPTEIRCPSYTTQRCESAWVNRYHNFLGWALLYKGCKKIRTHWNQMPSYTTQRCKYEDVTQPIGLSQQIPTIFSVEHCGRQWDFATLLFVVFHVVSMAGIQATRPHA